jgi:hypothetical protein
MNEELFAKAWEALHGDVPVPTALESPLDALTILIGLRQLELPTGHQLEITDDLFGDPWPAMLVGAEPEAANRGWAFQAAQLLVIGRGPQDEWLAIDEERDPEGRHRVYQIGAGGRMAHLLFPDLDGLLEWLCDPRPVGAAKPDQWSGQQPSVERSLELLWRLHPGVLYQSYRMGVWPADKPEPPAVDPESPGWGRMGVIWTLARFRQKQTAEVSPQLEGMELSDAHLLLMERLEDLEEAILLDDVPSYLADLALEEDDEVSQAARSWMDQFDRARADPKGSTAVLAEETRGLLGLLQVAVDELIRLELIEIHPQRRAKLVEELLEVTLKVPRADLLIPSLIEHLLDSRNVEEVFADDSQLGKVLSVALGLG